MISKAYEERTRPRRKVVSRDASIFIILHVFMIPTHHLRLAE